MISKMFCLVLLRGSMNTNQRTFELQSSLNIMVKSLTGQLETPHPRIKKLCPNT